MKSRAMFRAIFGRMVFLMFLATILCGTTIYLTLGVLSGFGDVEQMWSDHNHDVGQKSVTLDRFQRLIGYGGFIHNFKNYILRRDREYLNVARRQMKEVNEEIKNLRRYFSRQEEMEAIDDLSKVFKEYEAMLDLSSDAKNSTLSISDLDKVVKVNDERAIVAIDQLNDRILDKNRYINFSINIIYQRIRYFFWWWGFLALVVLLLFAGLIRMQWRLDWMKVNVVQFEGEALDLFDAVGYPLLVLDRQGCVLRANTHAAILFEYQPESLIGMPLTTLVTDFLEGEDGVLRSHLFERPIPQLMGKHWPLRGQTASGNRIWLEVRADVLGHNSAMPLLLLAIRDVSDAYEDRQSLEALLETA